MTVLLLFVGWAFIAQWVDRDADRCKTKRGWWNLLVLGGGYGGLAVLLLFPWSGHAFFLGLAFWIVISAGTSIAICGASQRSYGAWGSRFDTCSPAADHYPVEGVREKPRKTRVFESGWSTLRASPLRSRMTPESVEQFDAAQDFFFNMLWKRATDVDVLLRQESPRVVFKIDGVVAEQEGLLDTASAELLLTFLKQSAGLNTEERRRPQAGTIKVALLGGRRKNQHPWRLPLREPPPVSGSSCDCPRRRVK